MEAGIYTISFDDYLGDPCPEASLSRGTIVDLLDSPARAFWNHPRLNPQQGEAENEAKFDIGTAAHNILLEGGDNVCVIAGYDDWKKKEAREKREIARKEGKTPLLQKQYDKAMPMVEAAQRAISECPELEIKNLRAECDTELTYIWQEKNKIWCRIRVDAIKKNRELIFDYKTTGTSVNPLFFSGHINKLGYDIQSVFYRRGVKKVEGKEPFFVFMAQETEPPYFCSFHGLDLMNEDTAKEKVEWSIKQWRKHLDSGEWPGYPKRICYAEPKPWEMMEWEIIKSQTMAEERDNG